jgi:hypothetical protein
LIILSQNEARVKLETEKFKRTNATLKAEIRKNIDRIADLEGKFVIKTVGFVTLYLLLLFSFSITASFHETLNWIIS